MKTSSEFYHYYLANSQVQFQTVNVRQYAFISTSIILPTVRTDQTIPLIGVCFTRTFKSVHRIEQTEIPPSVCS